MKSFLAFIAMLQELAGATKQIAENKGKKIALTEDEIRQRSRNNTYRLKNKGEAAPWLALIKFYNKQLEPRWQLHAKNQIRDLVKSGADIISIELQEDWLVITYMRDTYKRDYFVKAKGLVG